MRYFSKMYKIALGMGAASGAVAYYCLNNSTVYNSWTTNYEPAVHAKWNPNWDHRSPEVLSSPKRKDPSKTEDVKPKALRHIILIRHGQYNLEGRCDDERILTKLGRLQAEYTGKRLKELGLPYSDLVKSTMTRAQETGNIISSELPKVPVRNCELLREGAPVPPEPPVGHWKQEQHQFYIDGARIEAAFRKYFHRADVEQVENSYTILVCHANVIRYFVCRAMQFPAEAWLRMSINHASITWLSITPSGHVILKCLGDSGHMPPNYLTTQ